MIRPKEKIPLSKALITIFLSCLLVSGTATMSWLYIKHMKDRRAHDPAYNIVTIMQAGSDREALKTVYLAELLDITIDQPQNLYAFDTKQARQKLLASPLIKEAKVKRITPGTLYIEYQVRQPVAFLGDYPNMAIDYDNCIFPFVPFFTPKRLPEIYLGLPAFQKGMDDQEREGGRWHAPLHGKHIDLAMEILALFTGHENFRKTHVNKVDVSLAFMPSYGQREVIVQIDEYLEKQIGDRSILCQFPRTLRFSTENFRVQIENYLVLRKALDDKVSPTEEVTFRAAPVVIDMRVTDVAFLGTL